MSAAQYARLVPKKYRSRTLPKVDRPWRPRVIAWAGPSAFYPNRFYEIDKWYKARIDKPEKIPEMHIIDPADYMKTLKEVLTAEPKSQSIDIGFKRREKIMKKVANEADKSQLEKKSRHMQLRIDTDGLELPSLDIYKHFQIFDHLFGENTYFENVQNLDLSFGDKAVFNGNIITASSTLHKPEVSIETVGKDGYNTLLLVNLDGNAFEKQGEVVQWLVSNIPNGQPISNGKELVEYLPPLPFYGTGYHRIAFVLFRHSEPVQLQENIKTSSLEDRVVSISSFYKANEASLTPSAIRFFQTSYDDSVKKTLHSIGHKSPLYEYEYTPALKPNQKEFPDQPQPFDLYMDMFRDPKEVETEMLEKRLETVGLEDIEAPKWIDTNYNENKRTLPGWLHSKILQRNGSAKAVYENKLDK